MSRYTLQINGSTEFPPPPPTIHLHGVMICHGERLLLLSPANSLENALLKNGKLSQPEQIFSALYGFRRLRICSESLSPLHTLIQILLVYIPLVSLGAIRSDFPTTILYLRPISLTSTRCAAPFVLLIRSPYEPTYEVKNADYTRQQDFGTWKVYCVCNVTFHAEFKYAIRIFPSPTVFVQWHVLLSIFQNFRYFLQWFFYTWTNILNGFEQRVVTDNLPLSNH